MKIKKINMIEEPRIILNQHEMNKVIGGELCASYNGCMSYNESGNVCNCYGAYNPNEPCSNSWGVLCTSYGW
ncbi:hypothetical protein M1D30_09965 [Prevotella sp. E15-22]|uniref:hypothetical protein n=1 Tax=Prevotella sp. E15-22 TaxID=2937774 RepID=UPI0020511F83|nr:hypothetical protein [Prevotella sp. E15-22]UPS43905.1 hypothetical protein M1D30_09965 [Prevotella sp. E15-22]